MSYLLLSLSNHNGSKTVIVTGFGDKESHGCNSSPVKIGENFVQIGRVWREPWR